MRALTAALCLALALAVSACGSVHPLTAARLSRLDPLTADPAAIAARISLPEGLAISPGGAVLEIGARRKDTGESLSGRYALRRKGDTWALAPADAAALRTLQAEVLAWKAEDAGEGHLSLHLTGCRTGAGPAQDAPISADLSLDGGASFLPLLRGLEVSDLQRAAGPRQPKLPAC